MQHSRKKVKLTSLVNSRYEYKITMRNKHRWYQLTVHTRHKLEADGIKFYINEIKNVDNEYSLTEGVTGYSVLRCASNDPYIMRLRLEEKLNDTKVWENWKKRYIFVITYKENIIPPIKLFRR